MDQVSNYFRHCNMKYNLKRFKILVFKKEVRYDQTTEVADEVNNFGVTMGNGGRRNRQRNRTIVTGNPI